MQMCLCGASVYECGYLQSPELLDSPTLDFQALVNCMIWVLGSDFASAAGGKHTVKHKTMALVPSKSPLGNGAGPRQCIYNLKCFAVL